MYLQEIGALNTKKKFIEMTNIVKIKKLKVGEKHPVALMGIINLSKESFYQQSYVSEDIFQKSIKRMINEKVDIIDIGARSTAPGVDPISIDEEKKRIVPILKYLKNYPDIPVSVDTQYSEVAELSLKNDVSLVNDISGFKTDEKIIKVIRNHDCPVVIMATKKIPGDALTIDDVEQQLSDSIVLALKYDYDIKKIIIDPGIGKWIPKKGALYNISILNDLESLKKFNQPILLGISRKSMIGDILGYKEPLDRLSGTLAATAIGVYNGADIIRTHDVQATRDHVILAKVFRNFKIGKVYDI